MGQKSLFDIFKAKNLRMKRLLKKVTTLKMLLFSMTVLRRVVEMIAFPVTQEIVRGVATCTQIRNCVPENNN